MKQSYSTERDPAMLPHSFPVIVSQTEGVSPLYQRLHWHTALEINIIERGSGYYLINGKRYDFRQGDIVLINSNDLHRAFETEELVMGIVMFEPSYLALEQRYDTELLAPFRKMGAGSDHLLDRDHAAMERLRLVLAELADEFKHKQPHYETVVRSLLVRLLALFNRYFNKSEEVPMSRIRGMETIRATLREMEAGIEHPWTLRELADGAHLSVSRFSSLFTQVVGTSPLDYLIQLRLSHAIHLLETTEDKIIDVAAACGFRNLSNFNRQFKQHVGKLPSELRTS